MSKMAPDIHPPNAMPTIVDMMRMPTRVPDPCGGKYSRTMMAYMGTMPPWNRPNSAETTYSDVSPSNIRYSSSATPCSAEPSSMVHSPPMRSAMKPEAMRLMMPKPSMADSISAPRAGP